MLGRSNAHFAFLRLLFNSSYYCLYRRAVSLNKKHTHALELSNSNTRMKPPHPHRQSHVEDTDAALTYAETLTLFSGPYLVSCRVSADLKGVGVRGEHSMMERLRVGVLNLRKTIRN